MWMQFPQSLQFSELKDGKQICMLKEVEIYEDIQRTECNYSRHTHRDQSQKKRDL